MSYLNQLATPSKRIRGHIEVPGFTLVETQFADSEPLPVHSHNYAIMSVVIEGTFTEVSSGVAQERAQHSLIIRPPEQNHSGQAGVNGARILTIAVEAERLKSVREALNVFHQAAYVHGTHLTGLIRKVYSEFGAKDGTAAISIEALLLEILVRHSRSSTNSRRRQKPPRWLETAREILNDESPKCRSLSEMAALVGVHPVHFARTFHRHYQCTVGEYVRRLRIEFACLKLSSTNLPLADIALESSFSAQSHFSTAFKQHTGMTPAEYRAATRKS